MKEIKHFVALLFVAVLLMSCDKDFNTIGTNLVDENNIQFNSKSNFAIRSSNFRLDGVRPVQTNNLSYNVLGYYVDPVYGETTANVLTQVTLNQYAKDFGDNPTITEVKFSMPYFSTKVSTDEEGAGTYELDSIYGDNEIKLTMYRSNYFLNDFAPGDDGSFEERQKYYSDQTALFEANLGEELFTTNTFLPDPAEIEITELNDDGDPEVTDRLTPRFEATLDVTDFNWLLNPANAEALTTSNNFKDFYRGIYFKAENITADGVLLGIDITQAEINVTYEYDDPDNAGERLEGSIKILFGGNKVNTFDNNFTYDDTPLDKLFLKGGEGSMAVIELFTDDADGDDMSDDLEEMKSKDWLINEANLEFYVDNATVQGGDSEPDRVFLYDIDNDRVLLDYLFDSTVDDSGINEKSNHLGILQRDASGNGVKYKIEITEHINSIVRNDSTNVKLGLVVTNNVNLLGNSEIKDAGDGNPQAVLSTSIVSHRGTVLYNETTTDDDKKLKLNIYYTGEDLAEDQ